MNNKLLLVSLLSLASLASSNAISDTPEITVNNSDFDSFLCDITVKINDWAELQGLPPVAVISSKADGQNWKLTTCLNKSQLIDVLDLPFVISVEVTKSSHPAIKAQ